MQPNVNKTWLEFIACFWYKEDVRYYIKFAFTHQLAFGSIGNLDGIRAFWFKRSCVQTPGLLFPPWLNVSKQLDVEILVLEQKFVNSWYKRVLRNCKGICLNWGRVFLQLSLFYVSCLRMMFLIIMFVSWFSLNMLFPCTWNISPLFINSMESFLF